MTIKLQWEPIVTTAIVGAAILAVSSVRSDLFATDKRIRQTEDVYFLPPPKKVEAMSLGYTYAVADLLWAHVLVSQGLHTFERRRFDNLSRLYDTINELDPTWRTPYIMADALITFQSNTMSLNDAVQARRVLERGAKHRPDDAHIWLNLGQFVSFVAPASYIEDHDPEMAKQWRAEGIVYLQRAAELTAGDPNIAWQSLGAATILNRELGQHAASIRYYERVYAVTEDEDLRKEIESKIAYERLLLEKKETAEETRIAAERQLTSFERLRARRERFDQIRARELPFVNENIFKILGPPPQPAKCAGLGHTSEPACATSWESWTERWTAKHEATSKPTQ